MPILNEKIAERITRGMKVAVLTGAGISSESGIPTFRGDEGLWKTYRPEELANPQAFAAHPHRVWEWYQYRRGIVRQAEPNSGHLALKDLEDLLEDFSLITQNVDSLHIRAGSRNILELHGNIEKNYCSRCRKRYDKLFDQKIIECPECSCGGYIRPDIVWFGEMLPAGVFERAMQAAESADLFLSIGTSAVVYPAAMIPFRAMEKGAAVIEVNPQVTELSSYCELSLRGGSGEILPQLVSEITTYLN